MDLDKIINSIYDIEKDCKCDDCKKAIKNRKWLKRKFKEYYKSKVNVALDDVSNQRELLLSELVEWLVINTNLDMEKVADFEESFKQ